MEIQNIIGSQVLSQLDLLGKNTKQSSEQSTTATTSNGMDTVSISQEGKAIYAASQQDAGQKHAGSDMAGGGSGGGGSTGSASSNDSQSIKNQIAALQAQLAALSKAPEDASRAAAINGQIAALTAQLNSEES